MAPSPRTAIAALCVALGRALAAAQGSATPAQRVQECAVLIEATLTLHEGPMAKRAAQQPAAPA